MDLYLLTDTASVVRVKCSPDDTIGDLKKLIAAQKGTKPEKVCSLAVCWQTATDRQVSTDHTEEVVYYVSLTGAGLGLR